MRSSVPVVFLLLASTLYGQSNTSIDRISDKNNSATPDHLPATLFPSCKTYAYTPVPQPDLIAELMNKRKRYRLVVGVGEFNGGVPPALEFVNNTVKLVDERLSQLGFDHLPSLENPPFLAGSSASKDAIKRALLDMLMVLDPDDLGVIYYIGHGVPTLDNKDLSLAVFDRPVGPDEGLRFSDVLGILELSETRKQISEIPHLIIILDTCFSGNVAMGPSTAIQTKNNLQRVVQIENAIVPDKITILTATADGDDTRAFELKAAKVSAFGYFLMRALNEDWACADKDSPDGIMTVEELNDYLTERLALAHDNNQIEGSMVPQILEKEKKVFIAYSPAYHAVDGARDKIIALSLQARKGETVKVAFADGPAYACSGPSSCGIPVSQGFQGPVTLARFSKAEGDTLGITPPSEKLLEKETVSFSGLLAARRGNVAGVSVTIKSAASFQGEVAIQPKAQPKPNQN
ncbi:MAG TPA: hypothetical protein VEI80_03640 [Candidatus Acidoferrales bacterium]|nr:hypothetical protein [Candidatus Acidoferrales bacterium]